jgi:hypothetical protein
MLLETLINVCKVWGYSSDMAKVRPAGHMRPAKLFMWPLSLRGLKIFVKWTPKNAIFEEKFDFLTPKMKFLKSFCGTSWDFHKPAEKF